MQLEDVVGGQNPWWLRPEVWPAVQPFRRDLERTLLSRIQGERDRRAHLVLGPRQVGKTEVLKQLVVDLIAAGWPATNITLFRFDDERVVRPVTAADVARVVPSGTRTDWPRVWLFDEIGKSPGWNLWLKRTVDAGHGERIVLTDSAAGLLKRGTIESGLGRWDEHPLGGLTLFEFLRILEGRRGGRGEGADAARLLAQYPQALESYLLKGGFPEHVDADPRLVPERLRGDIVDRAIRRDLAAYSIDVEQARRLFVVLVQDSGAVYVNAHRATDLESDPRTVQKFATLFEDAQLLVGLEARPRGRSGKLAKSKHRLGSPRKLFAADHGLVCAFSALAEPWSDADVRARVFEAVVFSHLRAARVGFPFEGPWFATGVQSTEHGGRKRVASEIDFWIETERGPVAIEVTSSAHFGKKLGAFHELARALGARATLLIHGSAADQHEGNTRAVPLPVFLLDPAAVLRSILP